MKVATILYCLKDGQVLLGLKKKGFGEGKWNGFGGKVAPDESIEDAARREMLEESGVSVAPDALRKVAHLTFHFGDTPMFDGHVYTAETWEGDPSETDEMRPQWFALDALPWDDMWSSDAFWLTQVLAGETLRGTCRFDEAGEAVEKFDIEKVSLF
jgi:8-oxo-dGTP pyrophosphatase MutT (NUDIX family)